MKTNPNSAKPMFARSFISVFTLSIFLIVGCERDFPNPNAPIVENVTVQSLVTGVEAAMRIDHAIYLRVVSVVGREAYYFEPADPRYTGELLFGRPDPGGFLVNRPWGAHYRTIANCRILLDKAAASSGTSKAGVEGFAKTIMAYQLLLNLNYLDENGIKLDFSGSVSAPFVSKDSALSAIATLLDEANTSLAVAGSAFNFTLSSGFTGFNTPSQFARFNRGLKARVSVYRSRYTEALTDLGGSFLNTGASMNLGVYHVYGTGLGDQGNEIFEPATAPFVKWMAHPTFLTQSDSGDNRFASKALIRSTPTTFDNLTTSLAVTIVSSSTAPFPIIRREELILLSAEAKIGNGDYAGAETDMNIVRAAAGVPTYTGTNASNALDRLLHEKQYSLFLEGHRWVDMRRYGRLSQLPIDRPTTDIVLIRMPRPETEPAP